MADFKALYHNYSVVDGTNHEESCQDSLSLFQNLNAWLPEYVERGQCHVYKFNNQSVILNID